MHWWPAPNWAGLWKGSKGLRIDETAQRDSWVEKWGWCTWWSWHSCLRIRSWGGCPPARPQGWRGWEPPSSEFGQVFVTRFYSVGFTQSRIRVKHFFTNSLGCSRRCRPPSVWPSQGDVYKLYLHKRGRGSNKGIFCTLLGLHVYDKQGGWNKKIRKYANVFLGFHASTFSVSVKFWKLLARFW